MDSGKDQPKKDAWNSAVMVKAISVLLSEIINENKADNEITKDKNTSGKNHFSAKKPPAISIQSYLERLIKYSKIEESTLILTLIYIDRICDYKQLQLDDHNIHRIILAGAVLAIKYNEDDYYSNEYYAKVGGVTLKEINTLELEAILMLEHKLFVEDDFFTKYQIYLKHYLK